MNASNLRTARSQARSFAQRWSVAYPKVVNSLRSDLDNLFLIVSHAAKILSNTS